MSRTTHKLRTFCPFGLGEIEVEIKYTVLRGSPATFYGTPQPADTDEVEAVSTIAINNQLSDNMAVMLAEWAEEWLADKGFAEALEHAAEDDIADMDARDEARMEERRADR